MTFRIETYKEEYLDQMVELGYRVLNQQWKYANQTSAKNLKKVYANNSNFDPSTKFYVFEGETLVGFMPSAIKSVDNNGKIVAHMEFPIVDKNYSKAVEVEKLLIDHAYSLFQERGVHQVMSRGNEHWGKTLNFVNEYGYDYVEDNFMNARIAIDDLVYPDSVVEEDIEFYEYDLSSDYEKMMSDAVSIGAEQETKSDFKYFENNKDRFVAWSVLYHKDEAVANVRIYTTQHENNQVIISQILSKENSRQYRTMLFRHIASLVKDKGVDYIEFVLYKGQHHIAPDYERYGMNFGTIKNYVKYL